MTKEQKAAEKLQKLFEREPTKELIWRGDCHDCGAYTEVIARVEDDGKLTISGGAVAFPSGIDGKHFIKCDGCFEKDNKLRNYQETEVFTRVVGYLRPVKQFNKGKQAEFKERVNFNVD